MKAQQILIAGPYRSGTDGDPQRIAANLARLEQAALAVYLRGHVPVIGEWLALPLAAAAGSHSGWRCGERDVSLPGGPPADCAVSGGVSHRRGVCGADNDVRLANEWGLTVYRRLEDIPTVQG